MQSKKHKQAWMILYPEGNGYAKPGCVLHHKDPTLKERDPKRYYEWRPEDLEVMDIIEHSKLHNKGVSIPKRKAVWTKEMREAASQRRLGKKLPPEVGKKISLKLTGRVVITEKQKERIREASLGTSWWNDGVKSKRFKECPGEGWVKGFLNNQAGCHWWTNGVETFRSKECPGEGFKIGRTSISKSLAPLV